MRPFDNRQLAMVTEFHRVFNLDVEDEPTLADPTTQDLRVELIREELTELRDAIDASDIIELADAIADLLYVTYGAALAFGIPINPVFDEVHRSNMSKLWSNEEIANLDEQDAEGFRVGSVERVGEHACVVYREDGKVMKSPSYEPPDLAPILFPRAFPDEGRYEREG